MGARSPYLKFASLSYARAHVKMMSLALYKNNNKKKTPQGRRTAAAAAAATMTSNANVNSERSRQPTFPLQSADFESECGRQTRLHSYAPRLYATPKRRERSSSCPALIASIARRLEGRLRQQKLPFCFALFLS